MVDVFRPTIKGQKAVHYYGKVKDPKTKKWRKVSLGVTDKQVARQRLREMQVRTERVAYGMIDPLEETLLLTHVADFMRHLEQQGRCDAYRLQTECQILKLALFCSAGSVPKKLDRTRLDDYRSQVAGLTLNVITADRVEEFMASLPTHQAARTRNGYRGSVINLFNFLMSKRKLAYNPLLCVTRHEGETKRKRRALLPEQLQILFDAAKRRPLAQTLLITRGPRKGLPEARVSPEVRDRRERDGYERALIYMTAFFTGFRRKELRTMRVKHLMLDAEVPHMHLPGSLTKNGKDAKLPLGPAFADQLRRWVHGRSPEEPVFRIPRHNELLKALKKDLAFAGIAYQDDLGRVFDFHSLRKSLGTHLRRAKVDPAVSQLYMRHSDIRLTLEVYNDDQLHDLNAEVVAKLPVFDM